MPAKREVPQATLGRIRAVVDAIGQGARRTEQIGQLVGCSPRHAAYGVAGARALELVADEDAPEPLTALGAELAQTERGSEAELALLRRAVAESAFVSELAPGLLGEGAPLQQEIVDRIRGATPLSAATAAHRAAMLLCWRRQLVVAGTLTPTRRSPGGLWRRLSLDHFRSFARLSVDLPPFAVLCGPNGSGKSNLVDALLLVRDLAADAAAAVHSRGGLGRILCRGAAGEGDIVLGLRAAASRRALGSDYVRHRCRLAPGPDGGAAIAEELVELVAGGECRLGITRRGAATERSDGAPGWTVGERTSALCHALLLPELRRANALVAVRRLRLEPDLMRGGSSESEPARLEESGANVATAVRGFAGTTLLGRLQALMAEIVPGLREIGVQEQEGRLGLVFQMAQPDGAAVPFDAASMSDGTLRAFGLAVAALQLGQLGRDELLIVEQPETGLHAAAARQIFDLCEEAAEHGAVLLVTHCRELVDRASDEELVCCEMVDGSSHAAPLAPGERERVRDGRPVAAEGDPTAGA